MTHEEQKNVFNSWLQGHAGLIQKIVNSYADSAADRDDLFQEVVYQLWRSIPGFKNQSAISTWMYRVSLNTAIKWFKKESRTPKMHQLKEEVFQMSHSSSGKETEGKLSWLYKQIHSLNEIDRSICLLLLEDLSYTEIAEIMGISPSHVGVKIHRIKKQLVEKSKTYEYGI